MYIMRVTVIPRIIFTGNIRNFAEIDPETGLKGRPETRSFPLIKEEPITLNIDDNPVKKKYEEFLKAKRTNRGLAKFIGGAFVGGDIYIGNTKLTKDQALRLASDKVKPDSRERLFINREIRNKLKEIIKDSIQTALDNDIGYLVDDSKSPPVIIDKPDGWEEGGDEFQNEWSKIHTTASFSVVRDSEYTNRLTFGEERVWRLNHTRLSKNDSFHKHKDTNLSCGYDYIVDTFSNKVGFKKVSKNKEVIDKVINQPTDETIAIYEEWKKLYWDDFNNQKEDSIHSLPEYIPTEEIEDKEWYDIETTDFSEQQWNDKDVEESLSILDLVKWCIKAKVRLNVVDHSGEYYLSYIPEMFKDRYIRNALTNVRNISVIVKYNHAYFITDAGVKNTLSNQDTRSNQTVEDLYNRNKYLSRVVDKNTRFHFETTEPKEKEEEEDEEEVEVKVNYILPPTDDTPWSEGNIHKHPPPTLDKLIELTQSEDKTHYYIDKSNLNGIVNILYKFHQISPTFLSGTCRVIHTATYENLKIYSNKRRVPRVDNLENIREELEDQYKKLWELYPNLRPDLSCPLPTDTRIADEIYNDLDNDEKIYSMMNSGVRKTFFENEIKADNRTVSNSNNNPVFSIDFKRAYTTVLKTNPYQWNVFDAVSQPQSYRGNFIPDYFYLVYNKDKDFPLRGDGLVLYHGSLIQHVIDRVDIMYVIKPINSLSPDHFVSFLDKVNELEESDVFKNITDSKIVVNNFIGNLKRKDGIDGYTMWLIDNKNTGMREMMKGRFPSLLVSGNSSSRECWDEAELKPECMLVAKPRHQHHFQTAQPIRLQVLEMINEQNYLLYKHYKRCLYVYKFVNIFQNDIKQRKVLGKLRNKKTAIAKIKDKTDYKPQLVGVRTDALYLKSPVSVDKRIDSVKDGFETVDIEVWGKTQPILDKFKNYLVDTWNTDSEYKSLPESQMDAWDWRDIERENQKQIGVTYIPNQWESDIDINYKWDKELGSKVILTHAIRNGGCWISGKGGRGKSEIIAGLDKMIKRNQIRYRWMRGIYKTLYPDCWFHKLEEWRRFNPCKYKKFAPTNKASNRIDGQTLHKGLCIPVEDISPEEEGEFIDADATGSTNLEMIMKHYEVDVVKRKHSTNIMCIDEISMIGGRIWSFLAYIKLRIPSMTFILMGDVRHQLKPVKEEHRHFEHAYVIKELANFNKITLHYNFRTGQVNDELWERCQQPETINRVGELTQRNLCYTHDKRREIIETLQNRIPNPIVVDIDKEDQDREKHNKQLKYSWGTPLIARKSYCDLDIWKSEIYYVVNIKDDEIELYETERKKKVWILKKELPTMFLSGFCITIHKSQSETYRDDYTIHQWNWLSQGGDNNLRLRYVATSRSDDWEIKFL